ncbi:hypothetical protein V1512DRAFT_248055 [Lipomyces arxii]|uniref:uncharacterized protein n=1 Tax=Lipomyces arxii TaxID=56418 RepID=UPI0034CE58FF
MTGSTIISHKQISHSHQHAHVSEVADQPEYVTRKRVGKACDSCRIKKSKCDGRKPCSRCIMDDKICTFTERKKSKEKLYSSRYVELLENRIEILQNGMAELVRRVIRGDDISGLLSKSGHVSINRALEELSGKPLELQKKDHEHFVVVHGDHDDSEHDTEHDGDDNDSNAGSHDTKMIDNIESMSPQSKVELSVSTDLNSAWSSGPSSAVAITDIPVNANEGYNLVQAGPGYGVGPRATNADFIHGVPLAPDPATIIRDFNHSGSMSPVLSTSSISVSPSPTEQQSGGDIRIEFNPGKPMMEPYDEYSMLSTVTALGLDLMVANKADENPDLWLTSNFIEI